MATLSKAGHRLFGAAVCILLAIAAIAGPRPVGSLDSPGFVTIDVAVTDKNGHPIAGLEQRQFKVFEDGVEQTITGLGAPSKPTNVALLIEFSDAFASYEDVVEPAIGLIHSLPPDSWIALVTFGSTQPEILLDFTRNRKALIARLSRLQMPFSRETRLYDAVSFVLDRMQGLPGKNVVFLLSTGHDTVSDLGYSEILKIAQTSESIIYSVGLTELAPRIELDTMSQDAGFARLQSENVMRALAEASGGLFYSPRFPGEYPSMYETVRTDLVYQYRLTYISPNQATSPTFRKLRIEVSGIDLNRDGKPDKVKVRHKKARYAMPFGKEVAR